MESRDEIPILFNRQVFTEAGLEMREYGGQPVRVLEYRVGLPGHVEDTLTPVEGVGVVRRSKVVMGIYPGLSDRFDWRLVELDGRPFDAVPAAVPLRKPRACALPPRPG